MSYEKILVTELKYAAIWFTIWAAVICLTYLLS